MGVPIAAIIAGGASLAGQGINAASTGRSNKKSREFSREMYDRQKQDNENFWNLQNEYNHPAQQMQRLKDAGLNPALMYGGSGGASSSGQSDKISTPDVQSAQFRTPEWGNAISSGATSYLNQLYDLEIKQAQVNNVDADTTVKDKQAGLLAAQTGRSVYDLDFETKHQDISSSARKENLRKLEIDNKVALDENERRAVMNSQSVKESIQRVLNMRVSQSKDKSEINRIKAVVRNLNQDTEIKRLDKELKNVGIQPHDPFFMRILARMINRLDPNSQADIRSSIYKNLLGF